MIRPRWIPVDAGIRYHRLAHCNPGFAQSLSLRNDVIAGVVRSGWRDMDPYLHSRALVTLTPYVDDFTHSAGIVICVFKDGVWFI